MATNPSVSVSFRDGSILSPINLAEELVLKIGVATDGPYNVPRRCSSLNSVLRFRHGPVVRSAAHHTDYSGTTYIMRCKASQNGSIGSVTKTPGAGYLASLGSLTLALQSYTLHSQVAAGAALDISTGWVTPGAPMKMTITVAGGGAAAHTQTVTYVNSAGDTVSETVSISGAGTFLTTGDVAQVLRVVSNIDPGGTSDYTCVWTTPGDRYNAKLVCTTGGPLGVTGGTTPVCKLSLDGGITYGRSFSLASDGIFEVMTYAGGLTAQSTGMKATVSAGSITQTTYGAIRVAGATTPGDVVYNLKVSGVTVAHVVSGNNTPLSVGVVGSAITVNSATDGGGAATTTGAGAVAAVLASAAAAALVTPTVVGAGTGLLAAAGAAGAANGGVTTAAKVEGVRFRIVNGGASQSLSITVSGKDVTLYAATDANGAQTTTASAADTALEANSAAAALLSVGVTGTGGSIVGCLGTYVSLPVSVATGDTFVWTTTPPKWTNADLSETFTTLLANEAALSSFSVVHIVGESSDTDDATIATFVTNAQTQKRQYKTAVVEGTYMGSTGESTWATTLKTAFATKSAYYGVAAGEANCLNSAYGTVDRMNVATPYVARLMICPISELPSHVDCETILGTKNALDGVQVRPNDGDPPLWQSEDTLADLNDNNFITLRTHPGRSGIYVRQGLQFTTNGSDYTYVTNRRIANVAAALAYDEGLRFLNANLLADPATGQLAEIECQKFEAQIGNRLRKKLVGSDKGRQHCSALAFTVVRGDNYVSNGQINGQINIVPRAPATTISISVGFSPTL